MIRPRLAAVAEGALLLVSRIIPTLRLKLALERLAERVVRGGDAP